MAQAEEPLNVLAERQIRSMLLAMQDQTPGEQSSAARAIDSLASALPGLSGMDDTFQQAMRTIVTQALEQKKN